MKINYDFPWYLQNSEGFMALYTGLYDVATNISPISLLSALDIDHTTTPEQLKLIATLYGLRGDFVAIQDALIYNIKKWSLRGQDLPDGYTQLSYIQSSGTQYIDTGLNLTQDNTVEIEYCYHETSASTTSGRAFGARYTSAPRNAFALGTSTGKAESSTKTFAQLDDTSRASANNITIGVWNTYNVSSNGFYIDGVRQGAAFPSDTFETPFTVKLFAFEQASSSSGTPSIGCGIGRCRRFKVYQGDTLIQDLVPCRRESDGEIGMYDLIATENNFVSNSGSGDFVAGPDYPGDEGERNYWSGRMTETTDLLVNYIKAKVQIRNKNLTLQTLKQFFEVCLAHRDFNPSTDISVDESTLHFDLTVSVDGDILNDMVTLLSVDPYPFGKPTGISYSINYVQE